MLDLETRHRLTLVSFLLAGTAGCLMFGAWFTGESIPTLKWVFVGCAAAALLFALGQVALRLPREARRGMAVAPATVIVLAGLAVSAGVYAILPGGSSRRADADLIGTWKAAQSQDVVLNLASFGFATYKTAAFSLRGPWHQSGDKLRIDVMTGTGAVPANFRGHLEWAITRRSGDSLTLQGKDQTIEFQRAGS